MADVCLNNMNLKGIEIVAVQHHRNGNHMPCLTHCVTPTRQRWPSHLHPSWRRYLIYRPGRDARLSWPRWWLHPRQFTHKRWSPSWEITSHCQAGSWTSSSSFVAFTVMSARPILSFSNSFRKWKLKVPIENVEIHVLWRWSVSYFQWPHLNNQVIDV